MSKNTKYVSHDSDENGFVKWSSDENQIWSELIERQKKIIDGSCFKEAKDDGVGFRGT